MAVAQQVVVPRMVYIHLETSNTSFIQMRNFLMAKGIKNCDFFLSLLDPDLVNVDPRDPNLSTMMKAKVMQECRRNYWYFLRQLIAIPKEGDSGPGSRYKLNRANLAMNFLFILNINQYVEIPRQFGKTVAAVCRYLWCYNFGTINSKIMFLHKAHQGAKDNLNTLKKIRDALPSYLQFSSATTADGKKLKVPDTREYIANPFNHNEIITFASARTPDSANNLGRGATMAMQFYDEFAFIPYNQTIYNAAIPAFSTAAQNAKANGAPYGILLTTTPGFLTTDSGQFAYKVRNNATPWSELYYDKSVAEIYNIINTNNASNFFMIRYTYQQLGADPDYFRRMVIELQKDYVAIRREVLLQWETAASDCPFSEEELEIIKAHCHDPIQTLLFGRHGQYQYHWYSMPTDAVPIIGVDVSGASWKDASAITVIDSRTTNVIGTFNCNYIPGDDLAELIYQLVTNYMPNAVINIERNGGFGTNVIQRLCKTSIKKNLYWTIKDKVIEEQFNGIRAVKKTARVRVYGTDSTKDVRARLIEILYGRVNMHKDKFIAPILYNELTTLQVKKNGKVEHSDNAHDDQLFSYMHALYVWYDGENLAERYHIQKNTIKTDEEEELEESEFQDQLEKRSSINPDDLEIHYDDEEVDQEWELAKQIINTPPAITSKQFREMSIAADDEQRRVLLARNKNAREAYCRQYGLDPSMYENNSLATGYQETLPDSLFVMTVDDEDINFTKMSTQLYMDDLAQDITPTSHVVGNLASQWENLH